MRGGKFTRAATICVRFSAEPVTLFAYPNGKPGRDYLAEHVQMVREAGFRAALSTAPGAATYDADSLQLPRISPWQRTPGRFGLALARSLWSSAGRPL